MKHVTVGVAGHIDHGKTALVKSLTGIETDRLPEERERGMSIVLGFAHLDCPGGQIDLIDVPGHERFLKAMIAGATGIDSVVLVVASTERIMPQTVEHLALCELLGVENGVIAVTKADLVSTLDREQIGDEVRAFLAGTFLAQAPIVFTSAVTGEGIADLRAELFGLLEHSMPAPEKAGFYLPVDRVFTMTGHGTVATGTLRRGTIRMGDTVQILPRGERAVVRGLEVHGEPVDSIGAGFRAAVNLRGVSKEGLVRGDILASPGLLTPTLRIDCEITLLSPRLRPVESAHKPLRHGENVRIAYGTREAAARIHLLDRDELRAGETAPAQLRFGTPQAAPAGERFVVRSTSPAETIGGGRFIDIAPKRHARHDVDALQRLQILAQGGSREKLAAKLTEAGFSGREITRMLTDLDIDRAEWDRIGPGLPIVPCGENIVIERSSYDRASDMIVEALFGYHKAHRAERGMTRDRLRAQLPKELPAAVFQHLLAELSHGGRIEIDGALVRIAGFSPESALTEVEREIAGGMAQQFARGGLSPPDPAQVIGSDRRRKTLYRFLLESGRLVETTDSGSGRVVVFHAGAIREAACALSEKLVRGQGYSVSELNLLLGTSRKYAIPLLEYLDSQGVTRRVGDLRFLVSGLP